MDLYKRCVYLAGTTQSDPVENLSLLPISETDNITSPLALTTQDGEIATWVCNRVFYISDIHLAHKVAKRFKRNVSDDQVTRYVKKIAKELFTKGFEETIHTSPIVIFGGDISSYFELAEVFYTEFMELWDKAYRKAYYSAPGKRFVYAILGNHEFWDFETSTECFKAYKKLFKRLGICFLQNTITWFGEHDLPMKRIVSEDGGPHWVELKKEEDAEAYERQMRYIHNTLIVGGVGFAGCNDEFNADMGIYQTALNRKQEIAETKKWRKAYQNALDRAKETNSVLVVLSHNPIPDWKPNGQSDSGCVYFSAHTHRNHLYHDEDRNIHIFANNQIGYDSLNVRFKEAYLYNRANPFAHYSDGYHEITTKEYLRFYDYMKEHIAGNGLVERQIQTNDAKFYMIKHCGYYGFFLVSKKGTYICAGGRIKKISKCPDIEQFNTDFLGMIKKYIKLLSPYRNAQEQVAEAVKSFGGEGQVHGCIIDIDFFTHIMLNPSDGRVTYYYSPVFGQIQTYGNLLALLDDHNKVLAAEYRKLLKSADNGLIPQNQVISASEMMQIDIKDSVYAVSNRMNQLQRLFDKKILRDWNDELLLSDIVGDANALPEK